MLAQVRRIRAREETHIAPQRLVAIMMALVEGEGSAGGEDSGTLRALVGLFAGVGALVVFEAEGVVEAFTACCTMAGSVWGYVSI